MDEKTSRTIQRWVLEWSKLYPQTQLIKYSKNNLNWKVLFEDIALLAKGSKSPLIILLDEIQWLAKSQSGFVSLFKESWLELEKHSQLKFILCGSSNKFFVENSGGEEKILRGLVTHSELWLEDLNLHDLLKNFAPHWSLEEGTKYQILDPYLNFYFAILSKYRRKILENKNQQLIFNTLIHSENGLSILNYSTSFEKSRKYIITNCPLTEKIKIMAKSNKIKVNSLMSL